ncbi:hypothetical protein Spa11_12520 [Botrimarina mediterranea]|uniref:Uncharacterized protein n=1 Tax=Botrimarina mediterranea TaxID=2528022 RepID=A0A518K5I7_9BACT|nr:hypothetical protein Spa11_12520 [Botrimarina mediterranea]
MIRTLLIVALLASPSLASEKLKGYVRHNGRVYAVIETTTTKQAKPRNDFYARARAGYLTANYGKAGSITVKPTTTTRRVFVPIK